MSKIAKPEGVLPSSIPELYRKKIWPVDLSKQYKEDLKAIAFANGCRIVNSKKITKAYIDHINKLVEAKQCAGFLEEKDLPEITVVPPKNSIGKKETKDQLLTRALDSVESMKSEIAELKAGKSKK